MGDNLGPAGAAAYAIKWLTQEGYEWIGWGDDNDPPPFPYTFERLLKVVSESKDENLGGVGAVGAKWDWRKGEFKRLPDAALHGNVEVDSIGGGYFIQRSNIIHSAGLPDARLFFGFFDPEYCLRIRRSGYRLLVDGDLMREYREKAGRLNLKMQHNLVSRYPQTGLWQRYYRTRNYIFMMRQTFQHPELARREALKALGRTFGAWTRGWEYGATFTRLQLRGILDGYRGRLGRTVTPTTQEGKIPT